MAQRVGRVRRVAVCVCPRTVLANYLRLVGVGVEKHIVGVIGSRRIIVTHSTIRIHTIGGTLSHEHILSWIVRLLTRLQVSLLISLPRPFLIRLRLLPIRIFINP